jgi:ATP diphosphatase
MVTAIERLLAIMRTLRDPQRGCPWDREQNFATIAPYTIEEAYEVADAIQQGDLSALRSELGDLLFQVVFHSQLAMEQGAFGFDDVVNAISDKMERRHPHVFGDTHIDGVAAQTIAWEQQKKLERESQRDSQSNAEKDLSVLAGITMGLPGLTRAIKLGKRAATVGFEWPDVQGPLAKLDEELGEIREAIAAGADEAKVVDEIGDVLFSVANLCRHINVDPEAAVRAANEKFERRFRYVEQQLRQSGRTPGDAALEEMDVFWDEAKRQEIQEHQPEVP